MSVGVKWLSQVPVPPEKSYEWALTRHMIIYFMRLTNNQCVCDWVTGRPKVWWGRPTHAPTHVPPANYNVTSKSLVGWWSMSPFATDTGDVGPNIGL